ncbi:hypothetical protein MOO45_02810 [Bombilactobacillus folatiphilus]|uniref:Uncharacterized protein n=1 Tax=Bombilactobacillus folatiphilus TaxID=2923362 RepID=A0ABY4PAQ4_9LACO|nr:hypothetical protein [Bombilactobacillus folatiphilus]UQS82596.1 hypothetical protein MOO45_02810 [Bombilactobacillus folatiphilus]
MISIFTYDYDEDLDFIDKDSALKAWIDVTQVALIDEIYQNDDEYYNLVLNGGRLSYVIDKQSAIDILKFKDVS